MRRIHRGLAHALAIFILTAPGLSKAEDANRQDQNLEMAPVTVCVVDSETSEPLREFRYHYSISSPGMPNLTNGDKLVTCKSPDGIFHINAYKSSEIWLRVEADDYTNGHGYPGGGYYVMKRATQDRRIRFEMHRGKTIRGVVRDAQTRSPIQGAIVSPIVFGRSYPRPDSSRKRNTDKSGTFEIRGATSWGIHVEHPDYLDSGRSFIILASETLKAANSPVEILLGKGEDIRGVVRDEAGKAIPGVTISDGKDKRAESGGDGGFVLKTPEKGRNNNNEYDLSFYKEGYVDKSITMKSPPSQGLSVVLKPCPVLTGRILNGKGHPVPRYTLFAGSGAEPSEYGAPGKEIQDQDGRFTVSIEEPGKAWLAVKAEGYTLWDTVVDTTGTLPIEGRLFRGVSVRGKLLFPKGCEGASTVCLALQPEHVDPMDPFSGEWTHKRILASAKKAAGADGAFVFEHIRPGRYVFHGVARSISPVSQETTVANSDLDLGSIQARGTGAIFGQVFSKHSNKGEGEPFAGGHIDYQDNLGKLSADRFSQHDVIKTICFDADEEGKFRVENVPVGTVSVSIPHQVTADIIGADTICANVIEGKATEVRFFDPSDERKAVFAFHIGDGSQAQYLTGTGKGAERTVENVTDRPPMFRVGLTPLESLPIAYPSCDDWQELDERGQIALAGVARGRYKIFISDWLGSEGFQGMLFEGEIAVRPKMKPFRVTLGGGSVTGQVEWSGDNRYMILVAAAPKKGKGAIRYTRCDDQGNFCARYLNKGDYVLYAHDLKAGWAYLGEAAVRNSVVDLGRGKLAAGASLKGQLPVVPAGKCITHVQAVDSHGIVIEALDLEESRAGQYEISGLWPGEWTLDAMFGEEKIASKIVRIAGSGEMRQDFSGDAAGTLDLVKPDPAGFREVSEVRILDGEMIWAPMALSNGLLVIRDQKQMKCLDVRGK